MSLRELFNAIEGFHSAKHSEMEVLRNVTYGAAKWNAIQTSFSKEQARHIQDTPFPWEKRPNNLTAEESKKRIEAKLKSWQKDK